MAVTVGDLALSLRLIGTPTDTIPAGPAAVLTRLLGVAEAHIDLLTTDDLPTDVADEATIRMASYLFTVPAGAGRRDAYANAYVYSGAGSLISRWAPQRAAGSIGALLPAGGGGTGTDNVARMSAAAALAAAAAAQSTADGKVGQPAYDSHVADYDSHIADTNAHHVPPSGGVGAVSESARLPVGTVALRLGWAQTNTFAAVNFTRADAHPVDGAAEGTVAGLQIPPFPPALNTDTSLYLHIWIGTDAANIADLRLSGGGGTLIGSVSAGAAQTVEGESGTWYVSNQRLSAGTSAFQVSAAVGGDLIASQPWVTEQIADIPAATGGGLTPVKVYTSNGTINTGVQFYETTLDPAAYYQILLKNDRGLTPLISGKFMEGLAVNDPVYVRGWLKGSATSYLEFEVEYDGTNIEFIYFGPNNTNFQTNLEVWRYT